MVEDVEVERECGRGILAGLRRFLSTMWVLVVRISQMGVLVSSVSASARRFFLVVVVVSSSCEAEASFMCLRRALEAFKVWGLLEWVEMR